MTQQVNDWTIGKLITWTTDYLGKHDSDSPRLDAEILLAEARGCQRIELYTAYDELADDETRTAFRELVQRRAEGTPVAYLVGRREFYSMSFRVTPDVLIPRPETEFVIVELLDQAKARGEQLTPVQIIDVGTGSGVLAITARMQLASAQVTGCDISQTALAVAQANAHDHQLEDQVEFLLSDLFAAVDPARRFDFVVSNPPYVSQDEYDELPRDVLEHEPKQALLAGETGTEIIERLAREARSRLKEDGQLIVELSPMIADKVEQLFVELGYREVRMIKDLAGLARVISAKTPQ